MATGSSYFKTYQRDARIQTVEETFKKGEVFTRAPLATGKVRILANYDLQNEGESITNRKGLRPTMVGLPFNVSGLAPSVTENISITQGYDAVEEDDKHYRLVVANKFEHSAVPIPDINLYSAPAELWVINTDENVTNYGILDEYDIDTYNMYAIPLSYEIPDAQPFDTTKTYEVGEFCLYESVIYRCKTAITTAGAWDPTKWEVYNYPKSYYHIPDYAEAHGLKIESKEHLARPVGCFAFGNDYYNFNTDGELVRAIYQPADKIPDEYDTTKIYYLGDLCTHEGTYWECVVASTTPGAWDATQWSAYTLLQATFITEKMEPKKLSALEANSFGFNMLAKDPYEFHNEFAAGTILMQGLEIYSGTNIIYEPLLNTPYTLRVYYTAQAGTTYKFIWYYRESGTDNWNKIEEKELVMTQDASHLEPPDLTITNFTAPSANIDLKIEAYKKNGSSYSDTPEKQLVVGIVFSKSLSSPVANRELKNYDLSKATGMVYWKNHIWLYGLAQEPTVLFASDINEPTYFPYPQNVDIFDEPVINVVPFNDNLLVFTKSNLYQLTLTSDGYWTRKVLQGNLNFSDFDSGFVQVVKNMVFFKSGDYYYMIVPKTLSLQNELAIAPVSKNIEYFLDNFNDNIKDLFQVIYNYNGTLDLVNFYNYLDYEDVRNVYVFSTDKGLFLNLVLLYNTLDRTWRTYTYESQSMYYPLKQDATKSGVLITPIYVKFNINGSETDTVGVSFIESDRTSVKDFYIPKNSIMNYVDDSWKPDDGVIQNVFDVMHFFKNYQLLDSGYRDHALDYNKRYRELQFKFNNVGNSSIHFSTDFILDGETRIQRCRYETEHIVDPSSPDYGLIYINRIPIENVELPGPTVLGFDEQDYNAWTLDNSRFPEISFWKSRLKVSGKGYTPRFRLICTSEEQYELLGYTWVYRQMYSR